ncbi:MAG: hypothetical protein HAW59_02380 [Betaproteobacteria bacterium]|nr:hypothetical protein [Betaproteobacteria bacterium]
MAVAVSGEFGGGGRKLRRRAAIEKLGRVPGGYKRICELSEKIPNIG